MAAVGVGRGHVRARLPQSGPHIVAAALIAAAIAPAWAGDRPYRALITAAAEEDNNRVWSIDTTIERLGSARAFDVRAECAFDPTTSAQLGCGFARERDTGTAAQAVELELKHLFDHVARDGWGWGISIQGMAAKAPGEGWRGGNWSLILPFSLNVGDSGALLHANVGWSDARGGSAERFAAIGGETEITRRVLLFAEIAREGQATLANVGVRHWLRKEHLAVDVSLQRQRGNGSRYSGFVLGLSWYDLWRPGRITSPRGSERGSRCRRRTAYWKRWSCCLHRWCAGAP